MHAQVGGESQPYIQRMFTTLSVNIAINTALSEPINSSSFVGGVLHLPSAWTAASIAFQVSSEVDGTYQPLYDEANALIELTVAASRTYALPSKLFGSHFIKLWSETAGSGVNQLVARILTVDLKG